MAEGYVLDGQLSLLGEIDETPCNKQMKLAPGHPVFRVKRGGEVVQKHVAKYYALSVSVDNRVSSAIERYKRISQERGVYPRNLQHTVLPVDPSWTLVKKVVLTDTIDMVTGHLPSPAPRKAALDAFDCAVLMSIYGHLVGNDCVPVFSFREVYRSLSHKSGNVALLSEKNAHDIERSIEKLIHSYIVVKRGRRLECLPLLPADIRMERIFGAITKAVRLRECPPFLIFAIAHGWLAIDRLPFSFHRELQATKRQISISFITDCIIADGMERLADGADADLQVEIPYTFIYNAANDEPLQKIMTSKKYSPTYCNRVRKVVRSLLAEAKEIGIVSEWEEYKRNDGSFERAVATLVR